MSMQFPSPNVALEAIFDALNFGLIVVDQQQTVLRWNTWMEKHSGKAAQATVGLPITEAFTELPSRAFLSAISNVLDYGLPFVMSSALHRSPLALFAALDNHADKTRIHQSITLTPIDDETGQRCCPIQVTDSSTSIKREKILRTHTEVLKKEATTDALTGVYNRRFFDEHFKVTLGHAMRQRVPLSVFMVDIDYFKQYNDFYGHVAGDKTLIQVATTLRKQLLRATDVLARYGGDPNRRVDALQQLRLVATNPLILACVAGIALNLAGIALPGPVNATADILGKSSIALGLMAVGAALDFHTLHAGRWPVLAMSGLKLVVFPLLMAGIAYELGLGGLGRDVVVLWAAMPTSAASYVLARQLGGNGRLMAAGITAETVLAALTLPAILAILT